MKLVIFLSLAYIIGSIPTSVIVCRYLKLPDPRTQGSGNPGTANVFRFAGKEAAGLVLLGDALKGLIPVLLARLVGIEGFVLGLISLAAVSGHIFPVFLQFRGGKGVATAWGALLGVSVFVAILAAISWAAIAFSFRYASLASLIASALVPFYSILFAKPVYFLPFAAIAALIVWRHQENIVRLKAGTENKLAF